MSNLSKIERTAAERRRSLRRQERENLMRVVGDDAQLDSPDSAMIAASSRDGKENEHARSCL
jgi:hypothetical protein